MIGWGAPADPDRYAVVRRLKAECEWGWARLLSEHDLRREAFVPIAFEALEEAGDELNELYVRRQGRDRVILEIKEPRLWFLDRWEADWVSRGTGKMTGLPVDVLADHWPQRPMNQRTHITFVFCMMGTPARSVMAYALGFVDGYKDRVRTEDSADDYLYGAVDGKDAFEARQMPPWVSGAPPPPEAGEE